ncbi:MAG: hypothetical protein NQU48_03605 [Hadesarchaea archaeon]|nr:hypothetical protein [Hadesarchaea archaeon]TDA30973.1 MAG: hypothetical protein DSO04_04995 [Hadesarchaea archaeon]
MTPLEILLALLLLVVLGWIFLPGWKVLEGRRLALRVNRLEGEVRKLTQENLRLREEVLKKPEQEKAETGKISALVRDLEALRSAIAGAKVSLERLQKKYGLGPGPELLTKILQSQPDLSWALRERLAQDILVGEVGRAVLRSLASSSSLDQVSATSGVPLAVVKSEVRRLQTLGYLDEKLSLTQLGKMSLS